MKMPIQKLADWMAVTCAVVIALMPFHAFLTVWGASVLGNYTALRLWKEVLLFGLFVAATYIYGRDAKTRTAVNRERIVQLIALYLLILVVCGLLSLLAEGVTLRAFLYGLLLDGRFLVFFGVTWLVTRYSDFLLRWWKQLLLIPAAVVVGFATLQYALLPADFLKHFGYGAATIPPSATIDQKDAYTRIQATLRGPNPLGAYLVIVLSAIGALLIRSKKLDWRQVALFVLSGLALVFTFSRSAWLGAFVSLVWLAVLSVTSLRIRRSLTMAAGVGVLVFAVVGYSLRDNDHFQNIFFHTNEHSQSASSSNAGHISAVNQGLRDIVHAPLGSGTGTAGPASIYNGHGGHAPARIAENYYIQIGQEAGLIGLGLFAAINVVIFRKLWAIRRESTLAQILVASFVGITIINMLMHAWTDDTLAYIWWGLAGAALAGPRGLKASLRVSKPLV